MNYSMKHNLKTALYSLTAMFTLLFGTGLHAEIYKWTDANGQTHYSATPPTQRVKVKNIEDDIRMSMGKYDPSRAQKNSADQAATEETEPKADESTARKDKKEAPTKELISFCKTQRSNLDLLKNNQNIVWEQFGKKSKLTQAQRKDKIKRIKSTISEECKGI